MAELSERDRRGVEDELDRLRMMRVAEEALALGDILPDFALKDVTDALRTSHEFLDRGPLVLAFFRGGWCPYYVLTMVASRRHGRRSKHWARKRSCALAGPRRLVESLDALRDAHALSNR